jgi:hypothetical protein
MQNKNPKISVILAVYNTEAAIEVAIKSILGLFFNSKLLPIRDLNFLPSMQLRCETAGLNIFDKRYFFIKTRPVC